MDFRLYFSVLLGVFLVDLANSSYIVLESSTSVIYPILTKKLQLKCVVRRDANWGQPSATPTPLYNLITANQTRKPADKVSSPEMKEWLNSSSHADLYRLLSLVVTIDEKENIASVTGCDAPIVEKTVSAKIHADGSCDSSPDDAEQGYLLLTFDRPLAKHAGTFKCEASALDSEKKPISIQTSLKISVVEPTLPDIAEYIAVNNKLITDLEEQIVYLKRESETMKEKESKVLSQVEHLKNLQDNIRGQNIQTGNATCQRNIIAFTKPYKVPPTVFVSVISMTSNSNYLTSYHVTLEDVNKESFIVNCVPGSYLTATLQWLAIDK